MTLLMKGIELEDINVNIIELKQKQEELILHINMSKKETEKTLTEKMV